MCAYMSIVQNESTQFQKANTVSIISANCLNLHSPLADCHICETICPQNALTFDEGKWEAVNCNLCGLCAMVCPTQVFQIDLPNLMKQPVAPLHICCSQNASAPVEVLRVNCIQQFSPLAIIYLLYRYPSITIHLPLEQCKQCTHQWYGEGFLQQLSSYQIPAEKLQIVTHEQKNIIEENRRRELFRDIFHRTEEQSKKLFAQTIEKISANFHSQELEQKEPTVFPSRLPLYALYAKKQLSLPKDEPLPFRSLSCERCTFCGACTHLCPTQALEIKHTNEEKLLLFHQELCINCNLCQKICMQNGLVWDEFMSATQFMDTPVTLARSKEQICSRCEHEFYQWPNFSDDTEPICTFCR